MHASQSSAGRGPVVAGGTRVPEQRVESCWKVLPQTLVVPSTRSRPVNSPQSGRAGASGCRRNACLATARGKLLEGLAPDLGRAIHPQQPGQFAAIGRAGKMLVRHTTPFTAGGATPGR